MKNILLGTIFSLVVTVSSVSAVYSGTNLPGDKKKKSCSSNKECSGEKKEECKKGKKSCCASGSEAGQKSEGEKKTE